MPYLDKNFVIFYLVIYIFSIKNINKNLALKLLLYIFKILYYKIIINDWPKKK